MQDVSYSQSAVQGLLTCKTNGNKRHWPRGGPFFWKNCTLKKENTRSKREDIQGVSADGISFSRNNWPFGCPSAPAQVMPWHCHWFSGPLPAHTIPRASRRAGKIGFHPVFFVDRFLGTSQKVLLFRLIVSKPAV